MALEYDNIKDEMTALRKAVQGDDAETGEYGSIQAELQAIRKAVENGWGSGGSGGGGFVIHDDGFQGTLDKTWSEINNAATGGNAVYLLAGNTNDWQIAYLISIYGNSNEGTYTVGFLSYADGAVDPLIVIFYATSTSSGYPTIVQD